MAEERIQKLISQAGIVSRRAAEQYIRDGRVTINGRVAQIGEKADLTRDTVKVDGEPLKQPAQYVYYLLNKPVGVISTNKSLPQDKRRIVRDLIPYEGHLFTVGRLDSESDGLILLTTDGELANRLMHPRYQHTKTYEVLVEGCPTDKTLDTWRAGVNLDGKPTIPAKVRVVQKHPEDTLIHIVMAEGRNRQIRRVAAMLGYPVKRLTRIKIDFLEIGHLKPGQFRELTATEIRQLKQIH